MADKAPGQLPSQPHHPQNNVLVYSVSPDCNVPALQAPLNTVSKQSPAVYYRTSKFDAGSVVSADSVRPLPVESVCSSSSSLNDNILTETVEHNENGEYKPDAISPPFGWKRILSNGIIVYVSPSNTALSSLEQIKCYVQTEGTCKCGLECPLHLPLAFNFDPKVLTKPYSPTVIAPGELTKLCNHKRKMLSSTEGIAVDNRFGTIDRLQKKKRKIVLGGGQVIIGGNQVVGSSGNMLPQGVTSGQHGVGTMYQGIPHGATLQQASSLPQGGITINQASVAQQNNSLPPGNQQQNTSSPAILGHQPSGPMMGIQHGHLGSTVGTNQNNSSVLGLQQGVGIQSSTSPVTVQQNVMLGMQQGPPTQQNSVHMNVQQNVGTLSMQSHPGLQQTTALQHGTAVNPSPAASPALSGGSLPPPSPLSTRMTPPIVPSSSRTDVHNSQFVKVQHQIPSNEVWRESNFPNGFMDYLPPSGGVGPNTGQDMSLLQHQMHGSPSPDLMATSSSLVTEEGVPFMNQNQIMGRNIVQNESTLSETPNLMQSNHLPPGSQILPPGSQVIQNSGRDMSVPQETGSVQNQSSPQTVLRRYPVNMSSQPQQATYQISQPVQIQYDNTRVCPPGYSIKYTKKSNNQMQQVVEDHQLTLSHPQIPTSYQSNVQSSSQHFSQQVVSNHHLIVSTQQNANGQQQIMNASHQNVDHTSIALQQNLNNQHSIQSVTTSKQSSSSQIHGGNNQEVGSSSIGRVRTPPWHQNKQQHQIQQVERTTWARKSKHKDEGSPSFLEDPSGYLAQQTAMLRQVVAGREEEEGPKTMASSHTASSNTLTSVLAGRSNTLTVSVGSQEPKPPQHIIVSGNGQFIIAAAPKVNPPSPLLLPAPLLLQPIDTVQLPQLVVPTSMHDEVLEKRKSPNKKRKLSPTTSTTTTMLLSPQPQQQLLTILPSKSPIANMIQPLNVVQNFPIQQFLVPSMVMSDGTILQDTVQVNLLPGTGMFSGGQNLLTPTSVVLRAPTTQPQQVQPPKYIHSPNQFVNFSGDISNQVVPATTNTTVVQQNTTTIVQQTTMVQQPSPSYILDKPNFILTSDKNNFILNSNGNNGDKGRASYVRNSVSTQTQNQVVQVSSTGPGGSLVMTTGGSRGGSPPDTTTLSPADQEVSTSVTSPDPSMVHCVSSSNLHDDSSPYQIDTTTSSNPYQSGNGGKPVLYDESYMHQPLQDKDITQLSSDDCSGKMLCTTTSDGSHLDTLEDSDGLVN